MTSTSNNEPTLRDLAEKLDKLTDDVDKLTGNVDKLTDRVDKLTDDVGKLTGELAQTQKWQDRTWDVIKWVGGISAGLAVSASIALVGIVLKLAIE